MNINEIMDVVKEILQSLFVDFDFSVFASEVVTDLSIWGIVAVFSIVGIILSFIFKAIAYLLQTIPLYILSGRKGLENRWLAFIPIAGYYLLSRLGEGPFVLGKKTLFKSRDAAFWTFIALRYFSTIIIAVAEIILAAIPFLGQVLALLTGLLPLAIFVAHHVIRGRFIYDMLMYFQPKAQSNGSLSVVTEIASVLLSDLMLPLVLWMLVIKKQNN